MRRYQSGIFTGILISLGQFAHADSPPHSEGQPISSEITPLASSRVHNWAEFFVTADFIYWQARQDGLSFAQEGNYRFNNNVPQSAHKGSFKNVDFGFEPGFKAGIGVDFRHDGWSLLANYTWLDQFDARGSARNNPDQRGQLGSGFFTDILPNTLVSPVPLESARARWKLRFNVIDVELARSFYISSHLVLKPYIGAKYAWIDQKYRVNYVGTGTNPFDFTVIMRQKQDFWGVGLRAGLNSEWHFTRNWSLYGALALSELYSQFETTRKDVETSGATPGVIYYVENNFHTIKPVLEMAFGVRYETFFSNDRYQLFFQAGWEEQFWFDHNQLIDNGFRYGRGDLTLQGLDIKAGFSF